MSRTHTLFKGAKRLRAADLVCLAGMIAAAGLPHVTGNILAQSIGSHVMIGLCGALAVYLMLRLDLLNFAVPGFMAIGGYAAAIAAQNDITDLFALLGIAFIVPLACAIPLGIITLRLKGVYFVLVTYLLTEIVQLVIVETPGLTGGTNGLIGFPPAEFLGMPLVSATAVYYICYVAALAAVLVTIAGTTCFGDIFDSLAYNDTLAQSLGLRTSGYKAAAFALSAGVAGLGGFGLVSLLITAHPLSFTSASSVHYIAYVLIGGVASTLGAALGTVFLVIALTQFSWSGEYSLGLFGVLLILAVLFLRGGISGKLEKLAACLRSTAVRRPAYHAGKGDAA